MSDLSQGLIEQGIQQGVQQGIQQGMTQIIINVIKSGLSPKDAFELTKADKITQQIVLAELDKEGK